ncbi:MAG: type II secretion system protein GspJ [Fimbriimonadaceae bacterium]
MRRQAGVTLIELMISMVIVVMVTGALGRALITSFEFEKSSEARRIEQEPRRRLEERITAILRAAFVSTDQNDASTYFIAIASSGNTADGADALVLTTRGERVPSALMASQDDFETSNARFGPQGGIGEVSLALTPIGAAADRTGLFLRVQRPADGDPTQGGFESVLEERVTDIRFQFFDGTTWTPEWDTDLTARRIPAAVHVRYTLEGEPERNFIVRLPLSDVTPENPVVIGEEGAQ